MGSASINKVILVGNLGRAPEARRTSNGKLAVKLRVATNRRWKDDAGVVHDVVEWHTVKVFGTQAEHCERYLERGRSVLVEGRLHTYSWDDDRKEKRSATEVVANSVQFIGTRPGGAGESGDGRSDTRSDAREHRPVDPPTDLDVQPPF